MEEVEAEEFHRRKESRQGNNRKGRGNHCGLTKEWWHKQGKVLDRSSAPEGKE